MKISVFVSCPTTLNDKQNKARELILDQLEKLQLEPRALGREDFPVDYPLREVYTIAKHCSGGIVLGFTQFITDSGVWKKGTKEESEQSKTICFPTPWNHLEAGILFGL